MLKPIAILTLVGCLGCGGSADTKAAVQANQTLTVQLLEPPYVAWDAEHGSTTVAIKLMARLADSTPLSPQMAQVQLWLDGTPVDNESVLQQGSEIHAINLHYGLVLDATYSMLQHQPPAFEPTKRAAQASVQAGIKLWAERPGTFNWSLTWFDDYIYQPVGVWSDTSIVSIPDPVQGAFTRLYAAVDLAVDDMTQAWQQEPSPTNTHHVLVVLSDGRDNHSAWDNSGTDVRIDQPTGLSFRKRGWKSTSLDDVVANIQNHPQLTVHAIGMGNQVNDLELQALAHAGHGIYLKNPRAEGVDALFERVTKEFTTIHTLGANLPNPAGDYTLEIRLQAREYHAAGHLEVPVHLGDNQARPL